MFEPFEKAAVLKGAAAQARSDDFGPGDFHAPLDAYLDALKGEAQVTQQGTWRLVHRIIMSLKRRAELSALLAREPEIMGLPAPEPVVIVGFPRTGTTLLHNLLASNPDHRSLRLWEARAPFAPADVGPEWQAKVVEETRQLLKVAHQAAPRLAAIHPMDATWPDECSWLLRNQFSSMVLAFSAYIPSYMRFLLERDVTADYAYYGLQLRALLHQRPGAPVVLKDPCHLWHLDALLATFPKARVIHLHRDMQKVAGSFCSLCHAIQEADTEVRPLPELGAYCMEMLAGAQHKMLAARETLPADRFIDLAYSELVAEPEACVRRLYGALDLPFTEGAAAGMAAWLERGRSLGNRNPYTLEQYGLTPAGVADQFAPYAARFADYLKPRSA